MTPTRRVRQVLGAIIGGIVAMMIAMPATERHEAKFREAALARTADSAPYTD